MKEIKKVILDGNAFYEVDLACMEQKSKRQEKRLEESRQLNEKNRSRQKGCQRK